MVLFLPVKKTCTYLSSRLFLIQVLLILLTNVDAGQCLGLMLTQDIDTVYIVLVVT
jgi:hypothetical protein